MPVISMTMKKNHVRDTAWNVTLAHARLALLVRIATTEKFGKEFEEF